MKQCGRCGTQNLDQQALCSACGAELPPAKTNFGGTLVMDVPEPPPPPPAPAAPENRGTAPARANLRGTMIGIAPPAILAQGTPAPAPAEPPAPGATNSPSQPPARNFGATMIGMAPAYPSPPPAPPSPSSEEAHPSGAQRIASAQKTVMGIARPGIAPLNPGHAKAPAPTAPAAAAPIPPFATAPIAWPPVPPPSSRATAPISPRRPAPNRISLTATLAIVGAAMLLVLAVMAFFMLRGHGSVTARASLDEKGAEVLDVSCSECPDGTKVWIDAAPVPFRAGKAKLRLSTPLKVGENPLVLVLERPGRSREEIALSLPIEFRVRGSTDELAQEAPKLSVLASVLPTTQLEVEGKPVKAAANEIVRFDYDVSSELTGPEASVKILERVVPYKASSPGAAPQTGQVQIRIGITPLVVDAPGGSIVVGDKELVIAGRTVVGSALKIGAHSVPLDAEGRFVSRQPLALGDNSFTVRATLKDHAPRLISVNVRRSDNLEREATQARGSAQSSYQEIVRAPDASSGLRVWLEGQLFDLRRDGYTSVLLVDVKNGCKKAPCLAKLLYGTEVQIEKGRSVKAFGKLLRFVDGPRTGERIPELRADLVVAGAK
jgi:hypothetical protein